MLKPLLIATCLSLTTACAHASPDAQVAQVCSFATQDRSDLDAWRAADFETNTPDETATELAACLGRADPFLRDRVGYEGLTTLLRSGTVSEATRRALIASLSDAVKSEDSDGFLAPFAALGLAELARTDRVEAFLSEPERAALASTAATYLTQVADYRAFSDDEGWRHGIAHGADFAMQLALNPNLSADSLVDLRDAIKTQIAPASGYAYTHGESGRLARPILFMASRGTLSAEDWHTWFEALRDPAPMESWGDAFGSERGLARLHNVKAFAQALYINASLSQNPNLAPIADGALELLKTLP
nr:DUF2785 domain-containing protein [Hyphomonas sp. Mor2]